MRALIISSLLLLHGMVVWAQYIPRPGEALFPKCNWPCTGRPRECPRECNQCLRIGNAKTKMCVSRGGWFGAGGR
uniref:Putative 5.3 kDa protein n=1 Tax=Ixodes ricinus TaxID=34613 RepID=A0A0K8REX2_IXORI